MFQTIEFNMKSVIVDTTKKSTVPKYITSKFMLSTYKGVKHKGQLTDHIFIQQANTDMALLYLRRYIFSKV